MEENEKAIVEAVTKAIKETQLTTEQVAKMISDSGIDTLKEENKAAIESLKAEHQKQLDLLGVEVAAVKETAKTSKQPSFKSILKEAYNKVSKNLEQNEKVTIKIPIEEVLKTILPASITSDPQGVFIPGVGQLPTRRLSIAELFASFPVGPDSHGNAIYMDQSAVTRNAAGRAVGDAAGVSSVAWTYYSQPLQSISDSIPVSKEMLSRYSVMQAEIENFIKTNLLVKRDVDYVTGDGNAPNIKGIYTYAETFDSANFAGIKTTNAKFLDLLLSMSADISNGTAYQPKLAIVNDLDFLALVNEKDKNGMRVNASLLQADGSLQYGDLKIVKSASMAVNTCVVGDFAYARRYFGESLTLEYGYNLTGDFGKRILTLLGNMEELLVVRNADAGAFLKSTNVATDIINITEVEG